MFVLGQHGGGSEEAEHVLEEGEAGARIENSEISGSIQGRERGGIPADSRSIGPGAGADTCSAFARQQEMDLARSKRKRCPISKDGWSTAAPGTAHPSALWAAALATRGIHQQNGTRGTPLPLTRCHGSTGMEQSWSRGCCTGPCHTPGGLRCSGGSWHAPHPLTEPFNVADGGGTLLFFHSGPGSAETPLASWHQHPGWSLRNFCCLNVPSGDCCEHMGMLNPASPKGSVRNRCLEGGCGGQHDASLCEKSREGTRS